MLIRSKPHRRIAAIFFLAMIFMFLPLPLLTNINPEFGLLANIQNATVLIQKSMASPYFDKVYPGNEDSTAQIAIYDESGANISIEFPSEMPIDEINSIMRSGAKQGGPLRSSNLKASRLRFREWVTDAPAVLLPYKYFVLVGLAFVFTAIGSLLFQKNKDS